MGESLLYLPALRELRRRLPEAAIDAVCASRAAREFFERCPEIRRVTQVSRSRKPGPATALALVAALLMHLGLPVTPVSGDSSGQFYYFLIVPSFLLMIVLLVALVLSGAIPAPTKCRVLLRENPVGSTKQPPLR